MMTHRSELTEAARLWAIRVADPGFDDWDGLTNWLESDPAHLAAYELEVENDEQMTAILTQAPGPTPQGSRRQRR